MVAVVVFEQVNPDFGEVICVVELMSEAARIARAGLYAAAGIHAEFQAFGVDVIGDRPHAVGELFVIGDKAAVDAAAAFAPAVVDDQIFVPGIAQTRSDHRVGGLANHLFVDVIGEGVPGIPAHRRGSSQHKNPLFRIKSSVFCPS